MHDMVITKNFSLLFDMRLNFSMDAISEGKNPWIHRRDLPARFGVLPKHATSPSEVRWIEVASCAVFHFANAWEEDNGQITVVGCRLPTVSFTKHEDKISSGTANEAADLDTQLMFAKLHIWVLDLKTNKCVTEKVLSSHPCDFVQIDPLRLGEKTRFVYAQRFEDDPRKIPAQYVDSLFLSTGLLKYDLVKGTVREVSYKSENGTQTYGTEAVFAARQDRDPKTGAEDDGYLVLYTHDESTQISDCLVYDATSLELKCRIRAPERIPYGFHAHWVVGDVLK